MRVVIQRVSRASVAIDNKVIAGIGKGILVFLGIEEADEQEDIDWLTGKIVRLRIFNDEKGIMNLSVAETGGDILVISQFTLHASTRKGNRPSYIRAARPEQAIPLYQKFLEKISSDLGRPVFSGEFGAMIDVSLVNDGPVTIFIDSGHKE